MLIRDRPPETMGSVQSCFSLNPEPSSKDSNVKNSTARHTELRKTWCMFVQLLTDLTIKLYKDKTYIYFFALTGFNTALICLWALIFTQGEYESAILELSPT